MAKDSTRLIAAEEAHARQLMQWFPDAESARQWGGPDLRFPFLWEDFQHDIRWNQMAAFSLVAAQSTESRSPLIAFGQCYERLQRHHLGRLVVAPDHRGQGHAKPLIVGMLDVMQQREPRREASLFVYRHNIPALRCYQSLGFIETEYPETLPNQLDEEARAVVYLVKSLTA